MQCVDQRVIELKQQLAGRVFEAGNVVQAGVIQRCVKLIDAALCWAKRVPVSPLLSFRQESRLRIYSLPGIFCPDSHVVTAVMD